MTDDCSSVTTYMDDASSRINVASLVGQSRQGDTLAREELLANYRPYLRVLAGQRLPQFINKRIDGSDIVQQTLIDAVRGLPDFRGQTEAEFTAWMVRLLERNLLQSIRLNTQGKRDVRLEQVAANTADSTQLIWHSVASCDSGPTTSVFRGEAALQLCQALERLPTEQRLAVELRYLMQQPLDKIAAEMEKSTPAVAGLIRRGVEALRRYLPADMGEI